VKVDLKTEGETRTLPALVDLTAYRIVQEALTNVVRHAGPAEALVSIRYEPSQLDLRVRDNGRGMSQSLSRTGDGSRLGLVGMHERVTSVGGELWAGNRREGGFEVRVRLPTGEAG
jgi:signal transduction histidine kinase